MDELDLGPLDALDLARPTLRKADGRRFVCVRRDDGVDVLDDRCPHEGYPLSGGAVKDGVLTCCWHNWKFDLTSGACLFGGEPVRRYPCRVEGGRVRIDVRVDEEAARARRDASLRDQLREGSMGSAMRDALRLDAIGVDPFGVLASDAARRAPWGFEHGLAMLADVVRWVDEGVVDRGEGFAAVSALVSEPLLHAPARDVAEARDGGAEDVVDAIREERHEDAEGIARGLVRRGALEPLATALGAWLAEDLTEYGHGAIYLAKALELAGRFEDAAEDVVACAVVALAWATRDSALPGWGATHEGIAAARATGDARVTDGVEAAVMEGERAGVTAALDALRRGVDPDAILVAVARAAATRVTRFDAAWENRLDAPVTILDVSHGVTFVDAALALPATADTRAKLAVQAAGFVGKLRAADGEATTPRAADDLAESLEARDLAGALGATEGMALEAWLRPCADHALHRAFVRPIFAAHAIKTLEACRRLEARDPVGAEGFRAAALAVMVPRRPERFSARAAHVARKFLADGRPPSGLY